MKTEKAYGSWSSPIDAKELAAGSRRLSAIQVDDDYIYWLENQADNAGQRAIVRAKPNTPIEVMTPSSFSVKTRVHEYGGGDYLAQAGRLYFAESKSQVWYQADGQETPRALTQAEQGYRYADPCQHEDELFLVREAHQENQIENSIICCHLSRQEQAGEVIVSGADFYAYPRLNANADQLAYIAWSAPNMPWDASQLYLLRRDELALWQTPILIAGESGDESIYQPSFGPDGLLYFVSDKSGWWNLYRYEGEKIIPLSSMSAELGLPLWNLASQMYTFIGDEYLVAVASVNGQQMLLRIHLKTLACERLACCYTDFGGCIQAYRQGIVFLGSSSQNAPAVVYYDLVSVEMTVLRKEYDLSLQCNQIAQAQPLAVTYQDTKTHAFFYPPTHAEYQGLASELAPLIVFCHGGPTAFSSSTLNLKVQFWTSRGFAVLEVNYGGSTGYGRAYRQRLKGQWGVVDVEDCLACVDELIAQGRVDPQRLLIRGSSAGGYTVLCALAFHNKFHGGCSYYGIADQLAMLSVTHKFEAHYNDFLIGPYPKAKALYQSRSPLYSVSEINVPLLLLHGEADPVVPMAQSKALADNLAERGVEHYYVSYPDEGHGFRQAETIIDALTTEWSFYQQIINHSEKN